MKPIKSLTYFFVFLSLLVVAPLVQAITISNGTSLNYDCGGTCNVTWYFATSITLDSLTVYDNAVQFNSHNLSFIPAVGTELNITVLSWFPTSNQFTMTGTNQKVTFSITDGNLFKFFYGGTNYDSSFTASSSSKIWYYRINSEKEACNDYMLAIKNITSYIGVLILIIIAGFVMFALVNGSINDIYNLVTLIFTIALTALTISIFLSISFSGIC